MRSNPVRGATLGTAEAMAEPATAVAEAMVAPAMAIADAMAGDEAEAEAEAEGEAPLPPIPLGFVKAGGLNPTDLLMAQLLLLLS